MTIQFYEFPFSPFCRSIKLLASIINVPLESKLINLRQREQHKADYLEKNPFHQVPLLNDDGFYVSESRAIGSYLVDKYAPDHALYPKNVEKRAIIDQMLYFDSGSLAPAITGLIRTVIYKRVRPDEEAIEKARDILKKLDTVLGKRNYAAGDTLTLADLCLQATVGINQVSGLVDTSDFKNVTAWAKRIIAETSPAYGQVNDDAIAEGREFLHGLLAEVDAKKD